MISSCVLPSSISAASWPRISCDVPQGSLRHSAEWLMAAAAGADDLVLHLLLERRPRVVRRLRVDAAAADHALRPELPVRHAEQDQQQRQRRRSPAASLGIFASANE